MIVDTEAEPLSAVLPQYPRIMRNPRFVIAAAAAAACPLFAAYASEPEQSGPTPGLPAVVEHAEARSIMVDRAEFIARLPVRVFVDVADGMSGASSSLIAGLRALAADDIDFRKLPPGGHAAKAIERRPPRYPYLLRKAEEEGEARFLLFIDAEANTAAVYCFDRTHAEFETNAAAALQHWRFSAATIDGKPVPAVVEQSIKFTLAK